MHHELIVVYLCSDVTVCCLRSCIRSENEGLSSLFSLWQIHITLYSASGQVLGLYRVQKGQTGSFVEVTLLLLMCNIYIILTVNAVESHLVPYLLSPEHHIHPVELAHSNISPTAIPHMPWKGYIMQKYHTYSHCITYHTSEAVVNTP